MPPVLDEDGLPQIPPSSHRMSPCHVVCGGILCARAFADVPVADEDPPAPGNAARFCIENWEMKTCGSYMPT